MNGTATIQVRVPLTLKTRSERRAEELGFSSVQEAIRVFLSSFSLEKVRPGIVTDISEKEEYVVLSPAAKRRIDAIKKDFRANRHVKRFTNPDKALAWLNRR